MRFTKLSSNTFRKSTPLESKHAFKKNHLFVAENVLVQIITMHSKEFQTKVVQSKGWLSVNLGC